MKSRLFQLSRWPTPELTAGCVIVDVYFAGTNFYDILLISGKYQEKPELPFVPGSEFSGVISRVNPDEKEWKVGERVYGSLLGAYAEKILVPVQKLRRIPSGMTMEQVQFAYILNPCSIFKAAGFGVTYPTSYLALVQRANLKAGETLLVHAAAGGVGSAAAQIGKALGAKTVIGTAGSAEKLQVVKTLAKADHAINYKEQDFVEEVKKLTNGKGVNVIYDPVGGEVFDKSLRCIAWSGRAIVVGFAGGNIPSIKMNRVLLKNCALIG